MATKIILKKDRKPRTTAMRNDNTPGYVYLMYDRKAQMTKIGLSRNPERRKWYLEKEYGTLEFLLKIPTFNMKWLESLMHKSFASQHEYREKGRDGFTEWFRCNWLANWKMRIYLIGLGCFVNAVYLLVGFAILAIVTKLLFG